MHWRPGSAPRPDSGTPGRPWVRVCDAVPVDLDRPRTRTWAVPTVFAVVALSMPVQMYINEHVAEPYPGLFQPSFSDVFDFGSGVRFSEIVLLVDGLAIDQEDLLPNSNSPERRRVLEALFPREEDESPPRIDAETRETLRSNLADSLDAEPRMLTARWERWRFDLGTRQTSRIRTLSEYQIDLTGGDQ